MSKFPATKARRVLAALLRIGWTIKCQSGSHKTLARDGWHDLVFAFHDDEEIRSGDAGPHCKVDRADAERLVTIGKPEDVAKVKESYTGRHLKELLARP